ncbi:substrate-binding domain-containing protein [Clostridium sp.]
MRKKYLYFLLLFLTLVIIVLSCGNELIYDFYHTKIVKEDKKIIAVSTIGATHGWPVGVLYNAKEEVKKVAEDNNWNYICLVAEDSNEQSRQVINLIKQNVDCIIMLPMDGASLKTAAKAVKDAEISLVIFDREIPDFAPSATVKGDNAGMGVMTARIFNDYFSKGTKVLEFMGDTSTVPQQRTDGFDDTIHDNFKKEQVGYISDMYPTLITPSPSTFSIWGVIYTLLIISIVVMIIKNNNSYYERAINEISFLFWFVFRMAFYSNCCKYSCLARKD